jgi:guanosine-3',5'-bis(diphosphate) 3'-pyrophosphohydrolase
MRTPTDEDRLKDGFASPQPETCEAPHGGRTDLSLILDALSFAAERHQDQRRKDAAASPYINHPIALARVLVTEAGVGNGATIAAALLHDTLEDTETRIEELEARFGRPIAALVAEVTDDKTLPKSERKRLQIIRAPTLSEGAKLIKLADKICNLRDVSDRPPVGWPIERRQAYFDWAKSVVDGLRGVSPALEAIFDRVYGDRSA